MGFLFRIRGFLPYIAMIFLNAFVDLGHKIVMQNTVFKIYDGQTQVILTAIVNGLILLPFILLFSPAGFLSDRYPKQRVMQYSAWMAVGATLLITASYYAGWFWMAFALTLALAIQSAIYSPAKYGYIRELVGSESLATANGFVQATTIVSILLGTFVFSALFEYLLGGVAWQGTGQPASTIMVNIAPLGWALVGLTLIELSMAYQLPQKMSGDVRKTFSKAEYISGQYLKRNLKAIFKQRTIRLSIIGLSMFWAISQVVLAAFPAFAKETLNETNTLVIQGILACSGIGIVIGSLLAGRISRRHIETGIIPVGACGIAAMILLLPTLESRTAMALSFIALGTFGGLFIVPLNSLIQYHAKEDEVGTVLAGNNWFQNVVMISFLVLTAIFAALGLDSVALLYLLVVVAVTGTIYTIKQLPHSLARTVVSMILKRRYRIEVIGFENLPKEGGALLLGNHISWIDWALVQIACPRRIRFVMLRSIYNKPVLKHLFKAVGAIPIASGTSKEALKEINALLKAGEVVCLFPEGAISRNGQLGEFKRGYERTLEDVDVPVVPFFLHGLWGSSFARSSEKLRENRSRGLKRDIIVAFGEQQPNTITAPELKQKVTELSITAWKAYSDTLDPVPLAWIRKARGQLRDVCTVDTLTKTRLSHGKMVAATTAFAHAIKKQTRGEQNVGLLLPASSAGIIANMAVMLNGQTAVNLNYTSSVDAVKAAIDSADIKTVYTSEKFLQKLAGKGIDAEAMLAGVNVQKMEEVKERLPKWRVLAGLGAIWLLPASWVYRLFGKAVSLDAPAGILFSSGSEGTPKGIVLSHRNFMSNIKQISDVLDTRDDDVIMGGLPPFHSFGLTVTSLLPLVEGIPVVSHPDPTDVLNMAKAMATYRATIFCGTATFLRLYAKNRRIDPLMLESLRVVVAGAEKLSAEVRQEFESRFNKTIYEGYGATETTPVASVNIPDRLDPNDWKVQKGNVPGSVGLPVPGSCFRIVDPDSMESLPAGDDGLILIAGNQVMLGYLDDEAKTADVIVELDGQRWYKTGDKGHLDENGFLTIVDRYSRFAKIGGEMISLGAVEETVESILANSDIEVLAVNVPDAKKGEKVILLVSGDIAEGVDVKKLLIEGNMDSLMLPAEVLNVEAIPKLGSGKKDFKAAKSLALSLL